MMKMCIQIFSIICMGVLPMVLIFLVIVLLIYKNREMEKLVLDFGGCHLELLMSQHEKPV